MRLEQCDKFEICQLQRGHDGVCQWSSAGTIVHRFAPAPPPPSAVSSAPGFPDALEVRTLVCRPGCGWEGEPEETIDDGHEGIACPKCKRTSLFELPDIEPDAGAQAQGDVAEALAQAVSHLSYCACCAQDGLDSCEGGQEAKEALANYEASKAKPPAPVPVATPWRSLAVELATQLKIALAQWNAWYEEHCDGADSLIEAENAEADRYRHGLEALEKYDATMKSALSTPEAAQPPREMRLSAEVIPVEGMPSSQLCIFRTKADGKYLIHSEMGREMKDAHDEIAFRINAFEAQPPREETR